MSDEHGMFALRRAKRHAALMKEARRQVAELCESGMGAHEIVAAFRARRRLCVDDLNAHSLVGLVPVPAYASELLRPIEDGAPIEPFEFVMLGIFDDPED